MWKVLLAFVCSRLVLYGALLFALRGGQPAASFDGLHSALFARVDETSEALEVKNLTSLSPNALFGASRTPFIWGAHFLNSYFKLSPAMSIIVLSNLFFLLFLFEVYTLLTRYATTDIASSTPILVLLWPTTYELSLGSALALTCYLATFIVRKALDDRWLSCGIALGFLAFTEPLAIGLVPLVGYYFWFYTRYYQVWRQIQRTLYLLLPLAIVVYLQWDIYRQLPHLFSSSAMFNLISAVKEGQTKWTVSTSFLGQTVGLIIFVVGAVTSFLSNPTLMHRIISVYFLVVLLLFSPYSSLASRAPLAGVCLQGIASLSVKPVLIGVQLALLGLSVYEILFVFGA